MLTCDEGSELYIATFCSFCNRIAAKDDWLKFFWTNLDLNSVAVKTKSSHLSTETASLSQASCEILAWLHLTTDVLVNLYPFYMPKPQACVTVSETSYSAEYPAAPPSSLILCGLEQRKIN